MAAIEVRCEDEVLAQEARQWLAVATPEAPGHLSIAIRLVDRPWSGHDTRAVLRQPGLLFYHGAPDFGVRLVWRDGQGHAWLPAGGTEAQVDIVRDAAANRDHWLRPFLLPVAIVLLRRAGWHHIHAATAQDPDGRGWMFAGDTHAGKSTTAALLATRGWAVGNDDTTFLVAGSQPVTAVASREPIALRDDALPLLSRAGGVAFDRRAKTGFTPEALGGRWLDRVAVSIVALAAVHDGPTRLEPVARAAAMGELLSWSRFFVLEPSLAQEHMDLLARLLRQAQCFRLALGPDMFDHPDLLRERLP